MWIPDAVQGTLVPENESGGGNCSTLVLTGLVQSVYNCAIFIADARNKHNMHNTRNIVALLYWTFTNN